MGRRGGPVAPSLDSTRVNERIRAREVRLIGAEGEQLGVMTSDEARVVAEQSGLDLVEVAANANPPVCRVMDYGKYKYEEKKKKAAGKAKSHSTALKEVKLRPGTDDHDLDFKLKNARRFLMDGDKVKVTVMFRGREMAHRENGYRQLDRVKEMLGDLAAMENMPRMEGRFLSTIFVANRETIARVKREEAKSAGADAVESDAVEPEAASAQETAEATSSGTEEETPAKPENQQEAPEGANA